jgi:hypothetical protein
VAVLQLVERPAGEASRYELALVERAALTRAARTGERPGDAISPGSDQLLKFAVTAQERGWRVVDLRLMNRAGRPTSDQEHDLEGHILAALRDRQLESARDLLYDHESLYVDLVTVEHVDLHARVTCNRYGIVNFTGPADEHRAELAPALIDAFARALGFER